MDDRTHQQIAPAALFKDLNPTDPTGSGEYQVNCNNPFLSGQEASILCSPSQLTYAAANPDAACINVAGTTSLNCADVRIGRRNIEGGGRLSDYEHENYRPVFGFKGDLGDAWTYDVYGQYFYTTFFNINEKYLNFQGIDNALQVTGTAANPTCVSGAPCVPYNIFADGGVTPAALNYLYLNGTGEGTSTLRTIHAEITGQLGKYGIHSPLATDGVGVDLGFEHRNDNEYFLPDYAEESGLLSGFGSAAVPINNSVSVSEEFLELRAPLVQNVTGVKELLFDGGYRRSDYTTSGPVNTYKFEVQYAPIEDYRLRLSYDKAIRAPSVVELYNPQLVGGAQLGNDPCAPTFTGTGAIAAPAQDTLAECEHMGVKASQYGNGSTTDTIPQGAAGQLSQLAGGNPNLQPEQAETYTIGINFAPSQVPNFKGSVDYYHIALSQEVTVIPAGVILANCAATGSPLYCSQIVRSNVTGGLTGSTIAGGGYIIQSNVNAGAAVDSGIDVQFNYKIDLPKSLGAVDFDMNGSYLQHAETTPLPGQHTYDCAGLFGFVCQTIDPRWHHIFSASWQTPWNVTATATWRYIGKVEEDNNDSDPSLHFAVWGAYDKFNAVIPSYSYLDLTANWRVNSILSFRAGFNNIMDKDPPIIDGNIVGGGAANTYPIYDMFGRQLFLGFTAKF
ncbi:MAG: TonB-dependent receptor domain-containing protein [Terriglobales bacterium]